MSEPSFLTLEHVEAIQKEGIERFGGILGIRDKGSLESAIFHPQNAYFYGGGDLFDVAAAYAYHIAEAQAFLDGNKPLDGTPVELLADIRERGTEAG